MPPKIVVLVNGEDRPDLAYIVAAVVAKYEPATSGAPVEAPKGPLDPFAAS